MKIGVLTLPLHTNYGGILQAYALQQVLKRMGHEAVLLDRRRFTEPVWYLRPLVYGKCIFCKFVLKKKLSVFYERDKTREIENKQQNTIEFIKKHIDRQRFKNYKEIKEGVFDCLIVGSDQVWRKRYACSMLGGVEHAYLDFAETWKFDATTDRIIKLWCKKQGIDTGQYNLSYVDYLNESNKKNKKTYYRELNKDKFLYKLGRKIKKIFK